MGEDNLRRGESSLVAPLLVPHGRPSRGDNKVDLWENGGAETFGAVPLRSQNNGGGGFVEDLRLMVYSSSASGTSVTSLSVEWV